MNLQNFLDQKIIAGKARGYIALLLLNVIKLLVPKKEAWADSYSLNKRQHGLIAGRSTEAIL